MRAHCRAPHHAHAPARLPSHSATSSGSAPSRPARAARTPCPPPPCPPCAVSADQAAARAAVAPAHPHGRRHRRRRGAGADAAAAAAGGLSTGALTAVPPSGGGDARTLLSCTAVTGASVAAAPTLPAATAGDHRLSASNGVAAARRRARTAPIAVTRVLIVTGTKHVGLRAPSLPPERALM
jgi:hypothetical protein